jgi:hypothetical protein
MKTLSHSGSRASFLPAFSRVVSGFVTAAVILLSLGTSARAVIDATITQKVWKAKFQVTDAQLYLNGDPAQGLNTAWLNADDDGDGIKNGDELAAGTSPFSPGSGVKITSITADATNVYITFPTEDQKQYFAQGTPALTTAFTNTGSPWTGTGAPKTLTVAKGGNNFFRILVQDVDSDGDGASDWAEKITGYNPNNAMTDGRTLDGTALAASVAALNQVTVTVTKSNATQPADALTPPVEVGSVTVSRGLSKLGTLIAPNITVNLQKLGTAVEGTDYDAVNSTVVFNSANATQAVLTINPKYNGSRRTNATAIVKAMPGTGYTVGSVASASVVINPAGIKNGTGLTAKYFNTSSSTYTTNQTTFVGTPQMSRTDAVVDFGATFGTTSVLIAGIAVGNPCVVTTTRATSLTSGDSVTIAGVTGGTFSPAINGTFVVSSVTSANGVTTFTVPVNCTSITSPTALAVSSATLIPASTANYNGWGTSNGGPRGMSPVSTGTAYSVRWTGQILPKYSETYFIDFRSDDSAKVWVNGVLLVDRWTTQGATDYVNTINLTANVPYDIQIDYWNSSGVAEAKLYWYSASQPKEIIPQSRLFPAPTQAQKITAVTNALTAVGYEGVPFNFSVVTPNISGTVTYAMDAASASLPSGLSLNTTTGALTGTPSANPQSRGTYNVAVNALNSAASGAITGSSVITITIYPVGSVTRETLVGTSVTADGTIPALDDDTDYGNNISRRLRGYIVPPKTGNYYFWLAANNTAELWISNDAEYVNRVKRATVTAGTGKKVWNASATQQSQWLSLVAGQKYYFDVLHNTGTDADSYVAMGWCQDDVGTIPAVAGDPNPNGLTPVIPNGGGVLQGYPLSGTVPTYVFQPYDYPAVAPVTGSLYSTNLGPQGSSNTKASGSANLQLNQAQTQAILHFSYQSLSSPRTGYHLHSDAFSTHPPGEIVFDIDDVDQNHPELRTADGGYIWNLTAGGTYGNIQQVRDAITGGRVYLNIHTVNYPSGEIRGNLVQVVGSQIPPDSSLYPEPSATDSPSTVAHAARFLNQATFGASPSDISYLGSNTFSQWIDDQLSKTPTHSSNDVVAGLTADINTPYPSTLFTDAWWKYSITAPDQLRQRLAFALSEILVVSWNNNSGPLQNNGRILADYYDALVDYCLPTSGLADSGNFRGVLKNVTVTPAMGLYLDMRGNQKEDLTIARHPNENYAREIMQLFSVGLNRVWDDGKFILDSNAALGATYTQPSILGMADLLTGWNYAQPNQSNGRLPTNFGPAADYLNAMVLVPSQHDFVNPKLLLNNVVTPAATGQVPRVSVSSIGVSNPCVVTTATDHGLTSGDTIRIAGVTGGTFTTGGPINAIFQGTVTGTRTFTVPVNCTSITGIIVSAATVTGPKVTPATYTGTITPITGSQFDSVGTTLPHPYDQYGQKELDVAIDNICNNDNVPPYICRQLIQRLVTSNPSPGYVFRVVQKWKNNGSGVRGDLSAVVRQILLDGEARSYGAAAANTAFGKQREPMLRLTGVSRAFPTTPYTGSYVQLSGINSNKFRITTGTLNDFSNGFTLALNFQGNYTTTVPPSPYTNPTSTTYSIAATLPIASTSTDIASIGTGNPTVITTTQPHGLDLGVIPYNATPIQVWFNGLSGVFSDTAINSGAKTATPTGPNTFTVAINTTGAFQVTNVATSSTGAPCTVTAPGHGLSSGTTVVVLNGINGGAFASNGTAFSVNTTVKATYIDANTFSIATNVATPIAISCSSPPTSYTTWREVSNPCRITTQVPHGLTTGDSVTPAGVSGGSFTPALSTTAFSVTTIDSTSFIIQSSCAAPSTPNTGNIQGGNMMDVAATGMVNVTYSQLAGSNSMTVNTGGPQTNVAVPNPNSATTTLKSKVYLKFLTRSAAAGISSIVATTPAVDPATTTITTALPHGLTSGNSVTIAGVTGAGFRVGGAAGSFSPSINSVYTATVIDTMTFTVPSNSSTLSLITSIGTGSPCTVTTLQPHNLTTGNQVTISGVSGGTFSPAINAAFTVTVTGINTFTVASNCTAAPTISLGSLSGNYDGGGLPADGIYSVDTVNGTTSFTVLTADTPAVGRSGNVIVPKISTSYTPVSSNNVVQYNCNVNHNMLQGDHVWVDVPVVGSPVTDAEFIITAPITGSGILPADDHHFQTSYLPVTSSLSTTVPKPSGSNNGITLFPLVAPPMGRSGNVVINQSTFVLGSTEGTLSQSPLNAPTVFNYFFPNYKFPGTLSNSNLDSPEFQLTTDTNISNLTNSLTNMFVGTGGGNGNLNGLSSFNNGGGSVVVGIGGYLTAAQTNDAAIPALIDNLANILVGAPLEAATKATIQNFIIGMRITTIGTGNPCTITTNVPHNLVGGTASVTISGVTGGTFSPAINATYTATVTGANTFTVPSNCTSIATLNLTNAGLPLYFPMTSPTPTNQQMRDRVRAIIHLIITSAEFAVQK